MSLVKTAGIVESNSPFDRSVIRKIVCVQVERDRKNIGNGSQRTCR